MSEQALNSDLARTPLNELHAALGGKMVPFAGYEMPVQYADGVKAEHLWTRAHAGLFDVSHMGPCFLTLASGCRAEEAAHREIAALIERLVPSDVQGLKPGQARLTVLLNEEGGILDDLIITRPVEPERAGSLYIVVNGAVKHKDWALIESVLIGEAILEPADDHILVALQGPEAAAVLAEHIPAAAELGFMRSLRTEIDGQEVIVSRCGYTGEDGFELLLPVEAGKLFVGRLLDDDRVKPIGLGARDSLRLEAGLCLYGQDIDTTRTPVEAGLAWVVQKARRERADFPGAKRILMELADGPAEKRVGIRPLERAPARAGTEIFAAGDRVGLVTSGGFGPSVDGPVAMGYVRADLAEPGTRVELMVRGKPRPAEVAALPFVKPNYKR